MPDQSPPAAAVHPASPDAAGSVWTDLLRPDEAERERVRQLTGLRVPTLADLSEIETSSRLAVRDGAIYLSLPLAAPEHDGDVRPSPLGIVLTPERLLTVRYADLFAVSAAAPRARAAEAAGQGSAHLAVLMLEVTVDHLADVLEHIGEVLDRISHRIFHSPAPDAGHAKLSPRSARASTSDGLRASLRETGRTGETLTRLRESLLGLGRVPAFLAANAEWIPADVTRRFTVLRSDVASLTDHIGHLTSQVQLLQDAILGFINIEQSNIIKVMTVVSVIGVPPTLVASIYGMNFHDMPELAWRWGYPYGLALIVASGLLPLLWFKRRGWL